MEKDLILKISQNDYNYTILGKKSIKNPLFAFVSPPKEGRINALTDITFCRESICEYIRQEIRGIRSWGINLNKLHLIVHRRVHYNPKRLDINLKIFQDQIMAGKIMANAIEKHYNWPLTRIYPVKMTESQQDRVPEYSSFYYIVAGKRWIKAPAMLSMFLLLFRIAVTNDKFKFKTKVRSIKSLFKALDDAAEKSNIGEIAYYREHGSRWKVVLDNYKKLFSSRDIHDLYFPGKNSYYFSEGINTLCDEDSKDKILNEEFIKLAAKRGV